MSLEGGEYVEGTNAVFQSDQFCVAGFSFRDLQLPNNDTKTFY